MIKQDGTCSVQKEYEGTRFVHCEKGWIYGVSTYTFCHCLNKKDEKMHTLLRSTQRKKKRDVAVKEIVKM